MLKLLKRPIRMLFNLAGYDIVRKSSNPPTAKDVFLSYYYQRHNYRRLEHLSSLKLDIANSTVLEVGAGIGDHTSFFLDRGCDVVSTEAREENLEILQSRYPDIKSRHLNLCNPDQTFNEVFDIVYCYGLLYHLKNPAKAIEFMAKWCKKMLLLETCVSYGSEESLNPGTEDSFHPAGSLEGKSCRPTRKWVYKQLKKHFEFVYLPITQPNHEEFPINWVDQSDKHPKARAIFIARRNKIVNKLLSEQIPMKQARH